MFKVNIAGLFIIVLIAFSFKVKATENSEEVVKVRTALVSYGLNLDGFEDALLAHILSYDNADTSISRYPQLLPRGRAFGLMSKNEGIDIVWGSATNERFASYLPVKIPIYKGLIGWRLALVKQANQYIFANASTLEDLHLFTPGQHHNWSDYKIFEENGFTISSGADRLALADMLVRGRFDFFPRAVIEIERELREYAEMDIMLEPHLLIRYKSAYVFYVAKNNVELAKKLTDGLRRAKADGSFDTLFEGHFKALFKRLDLQNRRIIELSNPLLPEEMLEIEEQFWISPKAIRE
jgi:hypothetical protein